MAGSRVRINRKGGRSGRPLPGFNHYTGMIFYGTSPVISGKWKVYPGPPSINVQQMFAPSDATAAGIIPYSDNIAGTGKYTVTTLGTTGDTSVLSLTVPTPDGVGKTITLGNYTVGSTETTRPLQATALAAAINLNTSVTGVSAAAVSSDVNLTLPKSYGVMLNTGTPLSNVDNGTLLITPTQISGGTKSFHALWYYHIEEYFNLFPKGVLYVGIMAASSSFDEVQTLQYASKGRLRWIGILDSNAGRATPGAITGTLTLLDKAIKRSDETAPMFAVYCPNVTLISDWSSYPDQNLNTANKVQCVISQDGDAAGANLFLSLGQTVGHLGIKLATLAKNRVSASDAQIDENFNLSDGVENDIIAFGNGMLAKSVTAGLQDQLETFCYTFPVKFDGDIVGTYWSDNKTCINRSSDFAYVNDNATMDMIARIIRATLIPKLNKEVFFNSDGTLTDFTIEAYRDAVSDAINNNMVKGFGNNPLISGFVINIDPTQPVKSTSNLVIDANFNQNAIARNLEVNISY